MSSNANPLDIEPISRDGTVEERNELSPKDRVRLLREWAKDHSSSTALLSDDAITRESIYGDRG